MIMKIIIHAILLGLFLSSSMANAPLKRGMLKNNYQLIWSEVFTDEKRNIKLSMDGKGRAIDNIFVERLWRSVKYEHVYLFPASDGLECYRGLRDYFEYYNTKRRHQSLGDEIPMQVYQQLLKKAA